MAIDKARIIPPAEYPPWIKALVDELNADGVGNGVAHVRTLKYAGPVPAPSDYYVRFKGGSDGHSAKMLRGILDKGYGKWFMRWILWPCLLAQGQSNEEEE